jgi:hypothetical protein
MSRSQPVVFAKDYYKRLGLMNFVAQYDEACKKAEDNKARLVSELVIGSNAVDVKLNEEPPASGLVKHVYCLMLVVKSSVNNSSCAWVAQEADKVTLSWPEKSVSICLARQVPQDLESWPGAPASVVTWRRESDYYAVQCGSGHKDPRPDLEQLLTSLKHHLGEVLSQAKIFAVGLDTRTCHMAHLTSEGDIMDSEDGSLEKCKCPPGLHPLWSFLVGTSKLPSRTVQGPLLEEAVVQAYVVHPSLAAQVTVETRGEFGDCVKCGEDIVLVADRVVAAKRADPRKRGDWWTTSDGRRIAVVFAFTNHTEKTTQYRKDDKVAPPFLACATAHARWLSPPYNMYAMGMFIKRTLCSAEGYNGVEGDVVRAMYDAANYAASSSAADTLRIIHYPFVKDVYEVNFER